MVVLPVQVKRRKRDRRQMMQRIQSLRNVFHYFDDKYEWVTLSEIRKDLHMGPNVLQRSLNELIAHGYVLEGEKKGKEPKRGRRRYFASIKNYKLVEYMEDVDALFYQRRRGRTRFDRMFLQDMITLSETTMTKNKVAKMFGLKSAKSFERLVRKYPSLYRYREEFRRNKENKSWRYINWEHQGKK